MDKRWAYSTHTDLIVQETPVRSLSFRRRVTLSTLSMLDTKYSSERVGELERERDSKFMAKRFAGTGGEF